jgi:hypothetical protein
MAKKSKSGPGRPRKAPTAPAQPKSPPKGNPAPQDLLQGLAASIQAKIASGKGVAHHEAKALREAVWLGKHQDYWPNVDTAAADLGVSANTVRGWVEQGCPGIEAHLPVHRASVLGWLYQTAATRGGTAPANAATIEDIELRIKTAKLDQLERSTLTAAIDAANKGLLSAVAALRGRLDDAFVAAAIAAVREAGDLTAAGERLRTLIASELTAAASNPIPVPRDESL